MINNLYLGWQLNMKDTKQSVSDAIQRYYDKFGLPPQILEVSDKLQEVPLPDGMKLVIRVHKMPANILLIGDNDETQKIPLDVEKE